MSRSALPRPTRLVCALLLAASVLVPLTGCGEPDEATLLATARGHLEKKERDAAQLDLKTLLQAYPQSGEGRLLLGRLLNDGGDFAGAEIELRRALEAGQPEAAVLPALALSLNGQGKGPLLLEQFGKVELADAAAAAQLGTELARAEAAQGDLPGAQSRLDALLARAPDHAPARLLQVRLAAAAGDAAGALTQLTALLARTPALAEGWLLQGELLQQREQPDLAGAAEAFQKAIAQQPDLVPAHAALIGLDLRRGDAAAAQQHFAALKKAAPQNGQTLFLEAVLAEQRGELPRARELCQALLRGTPNNPRLLLLAGQVELRLGALGVAEAHLSKAVGLVPKAPAPRRLLAQVQARQGLGDKALATLRPLTEASPPDAEALSQALQIQLAGGDLRGADATAARLAKLQPGDSRTRTALALSQLALGREAAGLDALQTIAASDSGTAADTALIAAKLRRGDLAGALKAVDALARKMPDKPLPDQLRGRIALQRQDAAAARQAFEAALQKDADYMPALSGLAVLDLAQKQPAAAKARFDKLLERQPGHTGALLAQAELAARGGAKPEEVTAWLERAVKAAPADGLPRRMLVDHLSGSGQTKAALVAAQAAVAARPEDADLLDRLGRLYLQTGDHQQAITSFNKLAGLQPRAALPQLRLADAQTAAGNAAAAAAAVRRAVELEPKALPVLQAQALLAVQQDKPADALAAARAIQAQYPDEAAGFRLEGELEQRAQRWDAAAAALRKALAKRQPGDTLLRLHTVLVTAGKTAEADKLVADARKARPNDLALELHLGDLAMARGDQAGAERQYRQVLTLAPENAVALNNLAYLLASQKKPGAVALAERALAAAPNAPALLDTLAFCLAAEQQLPKAIEVQAKAVAAAPQTPQFRLQLAKFQLQAGDKDAARGELDKLAALGDRFPRQAEVAQLRKSAQ